MTDCAATMRDFRLEVPARFNWAFDTFDAKAVAAPYKYPREIEFVADLPKTISGKIRRTEFRQMERDRLQRTPSPPKGERAG